MANVTLREMKPDAIWMIEQVNRLETVEAQYIAQLSSDGRGLALHRLENNPPEEIPPWSRDDIEQRIAEWKPRVEEGGPLLGAFGERRLVGFAALGPKQSDGSADLVALFVDTDYRRSGVGSLLMTEIEELARQRQVRALVVYSNRTASAVEFYLKHGCKIITLRTNSVIRQWNADPVFAKEL